jgi:hypothetical protein
VISQKRYVNIVSGVGAGAAVAERKLILRIITQNPLLTPGVIAEFGTADVVGQFFGFNSEEYKRALPYFGFINKNIQAPSVISFARWVNSAVPSMLVGDSQPKNIASFTPVTTGSLTVNLGAVTKKFTAIDLSASTDLTDVAADLQAVLVADTDFAGVTVTYSTNTNVFTLTGPGAGPGSAAISVTPTGEATDISALLGWGTSGSVLVVGQNADTPDVAVAKSAAVSNNFGSFVFTNAEGRLANADVKKVAEWNDTQNNMYIYSVPTPLANASALFDLVKGLSGCALNILSTTQLNDYVEQIPCEILAATNFNQPAANQNYMFYEFDQRNVTVSDDPTADLADSLRCNYIGVTQNAGQSLAFYQRGILCGGSQDAVDMNIYANEMWLKSTLASTFLRLFLAVGAVPASALGEAQLLAVVQPVITSAVNNGTFSYGKTLDAIQQQYISSITGDVNAWRQVQTLGYWIDIRFESYVNQNTDLTEWKAVYRLVYSKGDVIRFVEGSDVMV